jgi:BirA family biotin operon repressor/biotin-[acetyl-CoA-carboxylase] ligase
VTPRQIISCPDRRIGRRVLVFDTVTSTNDLAAALGPDEDGTAVVALDQTAGRGQYGRTWVSRPGDSLLMSVLLHPPPELARPVVLVALAAVAVADAVHAQTGTYPRIKWPNDLLIGRRKVCGVLIEQSAVGGRSVVIVGVGLNLNPSDADLREAGLPDATSLAAVTGNRFDPVDAASVVLGRLNEEYARLLAGDRLPLEARWVERLELVGRTVRAGCHDDTELCGLIQGLSFERLTLATEQRVRTIAPERVRSIAPVSPRGGVLGAEGET